MSMNKREKARQALARQAYSSVFGVPESELDKAEHKYIIENAAQEVWQYQGFFEGENEMLRDRRLDIDSVMSGDTLELGEHFKHIYPEFKDTYANTIIFTMYKRMKALSAGSATQQTVGDDSDKETKNISKDENTSKKQEEIKMNETMNGAQEIMAKLNAGMDNVPAGGSGVQISNADTKASRNHANETKTAREAFSEAAVVTSIILGNRPLVERLVNGEKTKGHMTKESAEKALEKFIKHVGYSKEEDTFKSSTDTENARVILDILTKEASGAGGEYEVYISNSLGTTKGFAVDLPNEGEVLKDQDELRTILVEKSAGSIKTNVPGAFINVKTTAKSNTEKSSDKLINKKSVSGMKGLALLQVQNRKVLLENKASVKYHKDFVDGKVKEETEGAKSVLCCTYTAKKKTIVEGEPTTVERKYRIPLMVEMYKTAVVDEKLKKFGDGERAVGKARDFSTDADKAWAFKELQQIIAAGIADSTVDSDFFSSLRADSASAEAADANATVAGQDI